VKDTKTPVQVAGVDFVVNLGLSLLLMRWLQGAGWGARTRDWLALGGLIPLGAALYGGLLWLLKLDGREELAALCRRFLNRTSKT
jgi:peptidoglycan biosynthesis protein MviN/MurJ (putative lipid II flippase)